MILASTQVPIIIILIVAAVVLGFVAYRQRKTGSVSSGFNIGAGGSKKQNPGQSASASAGPPAGGGGFSFSRPDRSDGGISPGIQGSGPPVGGPPPGGPPPAGYGAAGFSGSPGGPQLAGGPLAATAPAPPPVSAPPAAPALPAGWFADPSGRFSMRYWDGAAWTGHVTTPDGGQAFDPPPGG